MPFCKTCNSHYYSFKAHSCTPAWRCWDITGWEDPETERGALIYAHDSERAAERYVEGFDEVRDGDEFTIAVRPEDGGSITHWKVSVEEILAYHAKPAEPAASDDPAPEDAIEVPRG